MRETARLFLGGCSRSGTTFLQGLLANHSRIHTFPETGVFLKALGMRGWVLPWAHLGLTMGKERKALARLLDQSEAGFEPPPPLPPRRFLLGKSVEEVLGFLDTLTRSEGKNIWLEKTPRHVFHAARIRRMVPNSLFIHMLRDGPDVVASIVDRARKFPGEFKGQDDPEYGVRQWNRSLLATQEAMREPGHIVIPYQSLTEHPEETLRALCCVIGIDFEEGMLESSGSRAFVTEGEVWKAPVPGPISPAVSKFPTLFDQTTQARINKALDQGFFREVSERIEGSTDRIWVSETEN